MKEIMNKLQAPFSPMEIEWRVGSTTTDKTKGLALAYITNRAIQNRLDEVFGCFGWRNEFREWRGNSQLCGISILHNGEWITKWDGADDSNMEATKGGLSDAMKRAAYQWGIGRYLYELPNVWVKIKAVGKSYVIDEIPSLPKWALPEGAKPKADKPQKHKSVKEIMNLAESLYGRDRAIECIREYLALGDYKHTTEIPENKLMDFENFVDMYETRLPEGI